MSACRTISAVGVLALLMAISQVAGQNASPPATPPPGNPIPRLIEQLGSPNFRERQAARRQLVERDDAVPELTKALKSSDPEVRRQARQLLQDIDRRVKQRAAERVLAVIQSKGIDRFIDEITKEGGEDDATWRGLLLLTNTLAEKASKGREMKVTVPVWDYFQLQPWRTDDFAGGVPPGVRLLVPTRLPIDNICWNCFLVCRGPIELEGRLTDSIVFANGEFRMAGETAWLHRSIVFCDGDAVASRLSHSLIIATGKVTRKMAEPGGGVVVIENARNPLGMKLFDVSEVGLEVAKGETGVRIDKVRAGSLFARAGAQAGDRIMAIDRAEVADQNAFRRAVRRLLVDKKKAVFKVKRGDRTLELPVDFAGR